MTKIFVESEAFTKGITSKLDIATTKLESASKQANLFDIPTDFIYYSYMSSLKNKLLALKKNSEEIEEWLTKSAPQWEAIKSELTNDCAKIEVHKIPKRATIIQ